MVQIRVGDIYLDLYQFDPPKLNFAIEDITDTSAKSSFSQEFRIPATANNSEFFTTAFDINGQDFDVTLQIPAQLMVDGNLFREGELRLNEIYIRGNNEQIDYGCLFFGETRSFSSSVGLGLLSDLDFSEYNHDLVFSSITTSWEAYPSGTTTDGLFNGDILYPLIDHGNSYNGSSIIQTRISPFGTHNFTQGGGTFDILKNLEQGRFKPMIRVKAVWDKIFEDAGFTYTSNFLTGNTFTSIYLSCFGNKPNVYTTTSSNNMNSVISGTLAGAATTIADITSIVSDPGNNVDLSNNWYLVPQTGNYSFNNSINFESANIGPGTSGNLFIRIKKTSGAVTTTLTTTTINYVANPDGEVFASSADAVEGVSLLAGDKIFVDFLSDHEFEYGGNFRTTQSIGQISISGLLDDKYRSIDFIRDIITKFRLVFAPDKNISNGFIIEPWQEYIASGDEFDWTDKLDLTKDFKFAPLFYTQKSQIDFTDSPAGDYLNTLYLQQFEDVFGALRVFSDNILLSGERKVETQLQPMPVTQIEGASTGSNGMDNTITPQIHVRRSEDGIVKFTPVVANRTLLFYNGWQPTGDVTTSTDWHIINDAGSGVGYDYYPMVSHISDFPILGSSLDLNWQREEGYILFGKNGNGLGSSVYDTYWSNYIQSLYNKSARKVTAYFVLNAQDLVDFSFDDVIFVKDAYYYVEKIYDVPLGEKSSVKVELVKLLNR
jgi:hypothetical protein